MSWDVLMPMGAMAARYLKVLRSANPVWFYIHVSCQMSTIKLGNDSPGVEKTVHRDIGITLFVLGTLQRLYIHSSKF